MLFIFYSKSAFRIPHSEFLSFLQDLEKSADPCPDCIKIGHCQFQVDKRDGDIRIFEMFHELGAVEGIRLAEFNVPEQYPVSLWLLHFFQEIGMAVIVRIVYAAAGRRIKQILRDAFHPVFNP